MPYDKGNKNLDDYVQVHTRVERFRAQNPKGRILTTILDGEPLTVRAEVYFDGNESTIPNASAHASEDGGMSGRKSSAVEKTETAAVGRALAFCGYEVKAGIASREEMQRAQRADTRPVKVPPKPAGPVPVDNPEEEHRRLERSIREALGVLGKAEASFDKWVQEKYETESHWHELSVDTKRELLADLNAMVDKQVAQAR